MDTHYADEICSTLNRIAERLNVHNQLLARLVDIVDDTADSRMYSPAELALVLSKDERTLANWRSLGKGPLHIRVGQVVRYRKQDVDAWLDSRVRRSKSTKHPDAE